jgi:hypothetical protein
VTMPATKSPDLGDQGRSATATAVLFTTLFKVLLRLAFRCHLAHVPQAASPSGTRYIQPCVSTDRPGILRCTFMAKHRVF